MKRQILLTAAVSNFLILLIFSALVLYSGAMAAPAAETDWVARQPAAANTSKYVSVSSLAFLPLNNSTAYNRLANTYVLSNQAPGPNIFAASVNLPDNSLITQLNVFSSNDNSQPANAGAVQVWLKRCPHNGSSECNTVASAALELNAVPGGILYGDTRVDNENYAYILELQLSGVNTSLRSVRVDLVEGSGSSVPPADNPAVAAAVNALATQTNIPANQISLATPIQAVTWNDSSLGCPVSGQMYTPATVPGYVIILAAQGVQYEYHVDASGNNIVLCQK